MATSIAGPTQRGPRPGSLGRLDVERRLGAGTAHPGFLERHGYVLSEAERHELDEATAGDDAEQLEADAPKV